MAIKQEDDDDDEPLISKKEPVKVQEVRRDGSVVDDSMP